ncbi:lytic transglycosylase domain-containing protein [Burkholderia sp. LMG 21824]|uniref:lytic transglycosylase domain-containing protein n=1 Tax=Burkholderia sp. LMG 21824 TaxID=3158172 RepID=UPI003C307A14
MTGKKVIQTQKAAATPRSETDPVGVPIDDSARLREIRKLVEENNRSTLDENLVICQIYMESRFDARAGASHDARGLLQMQLRGVQQVYKYRKQKERGGHMPSDAQTKQAFSEGAALHNSPAIFDEATNIQIGTEYMQYWIDQSSSIEDAYKKYRGVSNGIYYQKISAAAKRLAADPDSMQVLRDMVKIK